MRGRLRTAALGAALCAAFGAAPAAHAATTVKPVADASVASDKPSTNFGTAAKLDVKASPATNAYLRFSVPALSGPVTRATLRLVPTANSKKGVTVAPVASTTWTETGITWSNAPPISSSPTVSSGAFKTGKTISLDVTRMVSTSGSVSFGLRAGDTTSVASREAAGKEPQLVIEVGTATGGGGGGSTGTDPTIMAAGDISCSAASTGASCQAQATSDLVIAQNPNYVLPLGDNQYECGELSDYQSYYDTTWGRFKSKTRPVPGNHEYTTSANTTNHCYNLPTGAPGYYQYFGSIASPLEPLCTVSCKGYYSYDVGAWHLIALNSNCTRVGNCGATDPQGTWLQQDLAAHAGQCTLAYFHHPRWTSGQELPTVAMGPIYQILYDAGADVILNGHDHDYERFAPMDPSGNVDPSRGIREIIAGTGGRNTTAFTSIAQGSELRNSNTFGVLKMTLHPRGYDWRFMPTAGSFSDSGSQPCHIARADDTQAPSAPSSLSGAAEVDGNVDLSWSKATDNVGVVGYRIERNGSFLKNVGQLTGYTDTTAAPGTRYSYVVRAIDASGNTSSASPTATVTTPSAIPGLLFGDGFETGSMDAWSGATAVTAQQGAAYAGSWGARAVAPDTTTAAWAYWAMGSSQPELYYRLRFKIASQAGGVTLLKLRNTNGETVTEAAITSTGHLVFKNTIAATTISSSATPANGTWHELQVHLVTGSSGLLETWYDGAPLTSTGGAWGAYPLIRAQLGDNTTGTTFDVAFDDVAIGTEKIP